MTDEERARVEKALLAKGVRMNIGGCGCCRSPWGTVEVDGVVIVSDVEDMNIEMIPAETRQ